MNRNGVLVVGSANMDLVVTSERFPKPGETVFGNNFEMFPGGKGANQAVSCSKLGARTYFLGKMGNDDFHQSLSKSLSSNGVEISNILIENGKHTGVALISVDATGENEIIVISGTNMMFTEEDLLNKSDLFKKVNVVLTQLEIPIQTVKVAADLSKENDALFILNPAPAAELPETLYQKIDYITPNESELELLCQLEIRNVEDAEKGARVLLDKGVKNVIVTLGNKGALLVNNGVCKMFPAYKVNAVDSTAAGDSFNGALAFSLSNGVDIEKAIHFANSAAALSVTKMGAQISMPSYNDVEAIL